MEKYIYQKIGTSLIEGEVTFFIGSGFSKLLSKGAMPSWVELLRKLVNESGEDEIVKIHNDLFEKKGADENTEYNTVDNEYICAQIIENRYQENNLEVKKKVVEIIKELTPKTDNEIHEIRNKIKDVLEKYYDERGNRPSIITTNYDEIIENIIYDEKANLFDSDYSGKVRMLTYPSIYHIHGSVRNPDSIVLTMKDYFKFQSKSTYVSRKLQNLIEENITVVLGYSLDDFNINKIFSEVNYLKEKNGLDKDIYYIVREEISDIKKEYFRTTFGIQVIDNTEIEAFFDELNIVFEKSKEILDSIKTLPKLLAGNENFSDDFLRLNESFATVVTSFNEMTNAGSKLSSDMVSFLLNQLEVKMELTKERGAFNQYVELADWLILFTNRVELGDLGGADLLQYKKILTYSFSNMSKGIHFGKSWHTFPVWLNGLKNMSIEKNRYLKNMLVPEKNTIFCWGDICKSFVSED